MDKVTKYLLVTLAIFVGMIAVLVAFVPEGIQFDEYVPVPEPETIPEPEPELDTITSQSANTLLANRHDTYNASVVALAHTSEDETMLIINTLTFKVKHAENQQDLNEIADEFEHSISSLKTHFVSEYNRQTELYIDDVYAILEQCENCSETKMDAHVRDIEARRTAGIAIIERGLDSLSDVVNDVISKRQAEFVQVET